MPHNELDPGARHAYSYPPRPGIPGTVYRPLVTAHEGTYEGHHRACDECPLVADNAWALTSIGQRLLADRQGCHLSAQDRIRRQSWRPPGRGSTCDHMVIRRSFPPGLTRLLPE